LSRRYSETRENTRRAGWERLVLQFIDDCATGSARDLTYWAQQLAYAPVFVNAFAVWLRENRPDAGQTGKLLAAIELALNGLDALPEVHEIDSSALLRLARRQADALGLRRRMVLKSLSRRLGRDLDGLPMGFVPHRMLRSYPLIGWKPEAELAGVDAGRVN